MLGGVSLRSTTLLRQSQAACSSSSRRTLSTTARRWNPQPPAGFFARPEASRLPRSQSVQAQEVAVPHKPPNVPSEQAPNYATTWSPSQNPRPTAMRGPRFEQMTMDLQPQPLSAMEMIQREPIRLTEKRVIECDGGDGALGHPRVFINLDKPGPKGCPYCGLRYERSVPHH